ncbi:glutathione S-transferase-like isoform X1 [Littorina saxatilis]|uniref:Glutathione S-transferase n=1 Tax=Littorina saxatilis TaxID=31220 RepID=A0AAN9BBU2_9CAEN
MDNIKLYYFDLRGKGEFIRLLLRAAGQKFDDVIVPRSSWGPEGKAETPYGQVPYIVYKGRKYGQSVAIGQFFARKLGFYGKTDEDALKVDEAVLLCEDLRTPHLRDWFISKDPVKKAELSHKLRDELFPRYFGYFEELLVDNGATGFFAGNSLTLADFVIYDVLDTALGIDPECLGPFPSLRKLRSNVEAVPAIRDYLAQRPKSVI